MHIMRYNHLFIIALFCSVVACTKKKDDVTPPQVDPPVTNNPIPDKPNDSTNTPPKPRPVLTDFAPANAFIGDTITLIGTNLIADLNKFEVYFDGVMATIISASATGVQVVVPDDIAEAKSRIQYVIAGDSTLTVNKDFILKAPVIESVTPTVGFARQIIEIKGKGFRKSYKFDHVSLGTYNVEKSAITPGNTKLLVPVPDNLKPGTYPIHVTVAGMTATATDQFKKIEPVIQSLSVSSAPVLTELTIKGENFVDPNGGATTVFLNDWVSNASSIYPPTIMAITNNEIRIKLPVIKSGDYKVRVRVVGAIVAHTSALTVVNP